MRVVTSVLELIGQTPLLRLQELEDGSAEIWAKLETANPGGSVKDRIGLGMVLAAEQDGRLSPGGTIVEATAGNTGIGLALAGVRRGYRVILVVPEKYSVEKQKLMRALGAEVVVTPTEQGMAGAQARAREITAATPGAVYVDQFSNPANPRTHELTTGPEIYQQTGGRLDAIVVGCGSGGTFMGAVRYLKSKLPELWAVAVEPQGSVLGGGPAGEHLVEGIGMDEIPPIMDRSLADEVITIPDPEAFAMVRRLARECGVLAGSSAGANVAAAVKVARRLGPGKRVVTVIPDSCERYLSKDILQLFPEAS
ncbi:cysteine synthase [Thermoanaerobaculum aquaticum]|uniref:Cysteine synthase n=1 Tax=Thermoanaerobaculum aquaticum TaxID=1312852 RepID=A0A062XVJ3_9BACT|nr:cysteine synthase A [Thermoanaerobaculum aquaticum]KDA53379.1 cysteine synthase [Thermoanaerobaculum aquaticum]